MSMNQFDETSLKGLEQSESFLALLEECICVAMGNLIAATCQFRPVSESRVNEHKKITGHNFLESNIFSLKKYINTRRLQSLGSEPNNCR